MEARSVLVPWRESSQRSSIVSHDRWLMWVDVVKVEDSYLCYCSTVYLFAAWVWYCHRSCPFRPQRAIVDKIIILIETVQRGKLILHIPFQQIHLELPKTRDFPQDRHHETWILQLFRIKNVPWLLSLKSFRTMNPSLSSERSRRHLPTFLLSSESGSVWVLIYLSIKKVSGVSMRWSTQASWRESQHSLHGHWQTLSYYNRHEPRILVGLPQYQYWATYWAWTDSIYWSHPGAISPWISSLFVIRQQRASITHIGVWREPAKDEILSTSNFPRLVMTTHIDKSEGSRDASGKAIKFFVHGETPSEADLRNFLTIEFSFA